MSPVRVLASIPSCVLGRLTMISLWVGIEFLYSGADIIDRAPSTANCAVGNLSGSMQSFSGLLATLVLYGENPPPPPPWLRETALVRSLRQRWHATKDGQRPLLAEANYLLTALETEFDNGNRKRAYDNLNVDRLILPTIGKLSDR